MTALDNDLYISYHKFSAYRECPAIVGYRASVPQGRYDLRNAAVGSCVHIQCEHYLKGLITRDQMYGSAPMVLTKFEADNLVKWRGASDRPEQLALLMRNIAALDHLMDEFDITPDNTVAEVTIKFKITGANEPLKLAGRVDMIQQRNSEVRVFDIKATTRDEIPDQDQIRFYFMLVEGFTGAVPIEGRFLLTSHGSSFLVPCKPFLNEALLQQCLTAAILIRRHEFPIRPGHACGYCDFRKICPGPAALKGQNRLSEWADKQPEGLVSWTPD